MSSHQPCYLQACPWVKNEPFSCWDCQFQLAPGFSKPEQYLAFPTVASESLHAHMGFFSSMSYPSPKSREEIFPLCLDTSFVLRGATVSPAVLEYEVPSQTLCCAHLVGYQMHLVENRSALGQHRQVADTGFASTCVWQVLVFPDACSTPLSAVLWVTLLLARLQTH
jgi:hypothetical protein